MAKKSKAKREALWIKAKRKCRLNVETLRMAKELGLNPRNLIKNIPNSAESWKAPVHVWIREMYERRIARRREGKPVQQRADDTPDLDALAPDAALIGVGRNAKVSEPPVGGEISF